MNSNPDNKPNNYRNEIENSFFFEKEKWINSFLGKNDDILYHSLIPYNAGGLLDIYLYPHHIPGTGFVSMEISEYFQKVCKPNKIGYYELAMFTRLAINHEKESDFQKVLNRCRYIMTIIANYSKEFVLNPLETLELPMGKDRPYACAILVYYPENNVTTFNNEQMHALTVIEIFRSEMEYAMHNGGINLVNKLKQATHFPYSDLDRKPVI